MTPTVVPSSTAPADRLRAAYLQPPTATPERESPLAKNQMVVFYGSPISPGLGILGAFSPDEAAKRLRDEASVYDGLNGDGRGVIAAVDLIYAQVQSEPTQNGLYLRYLPDGVVRRYIALAEKFDLQLILDLQIGRADVADEVRKIAPYLKNPRVHVAIDPEYAVGPEGVPLETPGTITGDDINAVQQVVADIVERNNLPSKLVFVHQYLEETIIDGEATKQMPNVDVVLNMDGFGDQQEKLKKYRHFAARPYAHHRGFNIFLHLDDAPLTENQIQQLSPQPDVIFYQ